MSKIDPRLRCLCEVKPDARRRLAAKEGFIAIKSAEVAEADDHDSAQVQIIAKIANPLADLPKELADNKRKQLGDMVTAEIPVAAAEKLEKHPNIVYVEMGSNISPENYLEGHEAGGTTIDTTKSSGLDYAGRGVIVGIVDSGCDYTHPAFLKADGTTRVLYYWNQAAEIVGFLQPPSEYNHGVEFSKEALDASLGNANPFRVAAMRPPRVRAHGTHVMGIAAGNDLTDPGAPSGFASDADIIFVQPDIDDVHVTQGFNDSVNLAEAVSYIFEKAEALNRPAVVNISMGTNAGPHDGTSLVERWIDRLVSERAGRAVVLALGNEHEQQQNRIHSEGQLRTGATDSLYWRVNPDDRTHNEMEIWYSGRDRFSVSISMPDRDCGAALADAVISPGEQGVFPIGERGTQVYISSVVHSPLNGDNQINIIMLHGDSTDLEAGVWEVKLTALDARDGHYDAWIERDARSRTNSPQSNFVGASYVRRKTLGSIQSGREVITVSNYSGETGNLADRLSYGPTRDGRLVPTVAAPGVGVRSANAFYQQFPGPQRLPPYFAASGTSMSAPYVAGLVACMLEKNRTLTAPQIRALLACHAKPALGHDDEHKIDWGYGRVDPVATLNATPPGNTPDPRDLFVPRFKPTPAHAIGPEYVRDIPIATGGEIAVDIYPAGSNRDVLTFKGKIIDTDGNAVRDAYVEVWHSDVDAPDGENYSSGNGSHPRGLIGRARFPADDLGMFQVITQMPHNYVITPTWTRAKHVHFLIQAGGYHDLITEIALAPDEFAESDFWRIGREELITDLQEIEPRRDGQAGRFETSYTFVLTRGGEKYPQAYDPDNPGARNDGASGS